MCGRENAERDASRQVAAATAGPTLIAVNKCENVSLTRPTNAVVEVIHNAI